MRIVHQTLFLFFLVTTLCCTNKTILTPVILHISPTAKSQPSIINIDDSFTKDEQNQIIKALHTWEWASSNRVYFIYYLNKPKPGYYKEYHKKYFNDNSFFMWKINKEDIKDNLTLDIINSTKNYTGYWDGWANIAVFMDRFEKISYNTLFYNIVLHEIGHSIGMKHIEGPISVMNPDGGLISKCITKLDAEQLCLIYDCKLRYQCN